MCAHLELTWNGAASFRKIIKFTCHDYDNEYKVINFWYGVLSGHCGKMADKCASNGHWSQVVQFNVSYQQQYKLPLIVNISTNNAY